MMRIWKDFKEYRAYAIAAAKAQLEAEVANSYLNWLWWILEPLCMMGVYAAVFGYAFGMKTENYCQFIFVGIAMYDFFSKGLKGSVKIVRRNKQIVTKVYIPKFVLVMSDLFVCGFKTLLSFTALFLILAIWGPAPDLHMLWLVPILFDLYLFTFAICIFLSHFGVFVEDLSNALNILLKPLFYFTGVFYSIQDKFPAAYAKALLRCYPVAKLVSMARDALLYGKNVNGWYLAALAFASAAVSAVGIRFVYRHENSYVKAI